MPPSPSPTATTPAATPRPPQGQALPLGEGSWWLSPGSKLWRVNILLAMSQLGLQWETVPFSGCGPCLGLLPQPSRCRPQIADSLFESYLPPLL